LFFKKKKPWERQHHGSTHVEFILSTNVQTLFAVLWPAVSLPRLLLFSGLILILELLQQTKQIYLNNQN
jgi:hypothetical protein